MTEKKATDKQVKYIFYTCILITLGLVINFLIGSIKPLPYESGYWFGLMTGISLVMAITTKVELSFRKERAKLK